MTAEEFEKLYAAKGGVTVERSRIIMRLMDRYRGTRGLLGWLVMRADRRWLNRIKRAALEIQREMRQR